MGQSRGGGYQKVDTLTPQQQGLQNQYLAQAFPWQQQAAQGYAQFLPGGGGGQPIIDAAQKRYQQQTIPSILNAFGSNAKSSSALNQALASSGASLNTDLGALLAQLQLQASQGLGNMGQSAGQVGLGTSSFDFLRKQPPIWQQALQAALGGAGGAAAGGLTGGPAGAFAGGIQGAGYGLGGGQF